MNGEIINTIERVKRQREQKYGYNSWSQVYEKAIFECFDKLKILQKNLWVEGKSVTNRARKAEFSSKERYKMNIVNKLIITIVGEIQKML